MASSVACPCCRSLTLTARARYQLCPVCFWLDDGRDDSSAHLGQAPSLKEARKNFAAFGACELQARGHVRPPRPEEIPAEGRSCFASSGSGRPRPRDETPTPHPEG